MESKGNQKIFLKASKGDLASQLGMSQETLSRKLTVLNRQRIEDIVRGK
ncbi:MAG: winged helix-turn-helix domain-containing protein [Spirochaetales bacterium]|nr:winged helix-turn-helix domain-containing protein [Spirochaetales bacterium]